MADRTMHDAAIDALLDIINTGHAAPFDYGDPVAADYPQAAECKKCGADCTDLLNADTIQFYGPPPEREANEPARLPVDPFLASQDVR